MMLPGSGIQHKNEANEKIHSFPKKCYLEIIENKIQTISEIREKLPR